MSEILHKIKTELDEIISSLDNYISTDEPLNKSKGYWYYPGVTKQNLMEEIEDTIELIENSPINEFDEAPIELSYIHTSLEYFRKNTVQNIWSNPQDAMPAFFFTIYSVRKQLKKLLISDDSKELLKKLKDQRRRVRSLESSLNDIEPKTNSLKDMVLEIQEAHSTAEQLPTDLASLSEARESVTKLEAEAQADKIKINSIKEEIETLKVTLSNSANEADEVLKKCETAYSAATSVGLAAAFSERSDRLSSSMWVWVVGLILSLGAGGYFGSTQLQKLLELLSQKDISTTSMSINFIMAILAIGAPVWFSWLATKQIGQRFKLSEDYAFKASVSRAYEGFRKETARIDKNMEAKLLNSALTRLDELPLRLVENENHGSPWHELASSNIIKQAMSKIPSFPEKVKELANKEITKSDVIGISKSKKTSLDEDE